MAETVQAWAEEAATAEKIDPFAEEPDEDAAKEAYDATDAQGEEGATSKKKGTPEEEAFKTRIRNEYAAYSEQELLQKLYTASYSNNATGITKLAKNHGVDVNQLVDGNHTAMFGAAHPGCVEAIKALLEEGADVKVADSAGATVLHYACMAGTSPETVEVLVSAGANPNLPDKDGSTPLLLALEHDTDQGRACVHALLRSGTVDADGIEGSSRTPLHFLIMLRDDLEMVQALLEIGGADPKKPDSEGNLPVHYAVDLGRLHTIQQILASELSLSNSTATAGSSLTLPNAAGLTSLHLAALHGNGLLCEFLSSMLDDSSSAVLNAVDNTGHTALMFAAAEGYLDCVKSFCAAGADFNKQNPKGLTALHLAIASRKKPASEELIHAGTNLTVITQQNSSSYLHFACQNGMEDLIPLLIEHGAPLNALDNDGRTALHVAAFSGSDKGCRSLLALGLSAADVDLDGKLPMHLAAQGGQVDSLQYLLQQGANLRPEPITVDARTYARRDLLYLAAFSGQEEVVAMLLDLDMGDMKEKVDRDGRTALHAAAYGGNPTVVVMLLDGGWDLEVEDYKGRTPLFAAAEAQNELTIKILVEAGASVLVQSKLQESALHAAAKGNFVQGILCLMEAGSEVNALDHRRRTALHEAAYCGNELAGLALVRLGADIELKDKYGLSPVAAAVAANHRAMAKALEDEACRSSDFQKRDITEAAYKTLDKFKAQEVPPDVSDVPDKYRPEKGKHGIDHFSLGDDDRGSPGSPGARRRRRGSPGQGGVGPADGGRAPEEEEEKVVKFLDPDKVEDPEMKEMINDLNRELTRKQEMDSDEEDDKMSLGSSLGSGYEFADDRD